MVEIICIHVCGTNEATAATIIAMVAASLLMSTVTVFLSSVTAFFAISF